jgi:hypothetical protein
VTAPRPVRHLSASAIIRGSVDLFCDQCRREFRVYRSQRRSTKIFCSRTCQDTARRQTAEDRLWSHTKKGDGCWLWTGHLNRFGYGRIRRGTVADGQVFAHVLAWESHFGSVPEGLHVLHRCDVPSCVRPDHLFLGTIAENNRDCAEKGRNARGEKMKWAKLTALSVTMMRHEYVAGASKAELGRRYGVSEATVRSAISGKSWRHV